MTAERPPPGITIGRVRIRGLAGRAPTEAAVRAALNRAFASLGPAEPARSGAAPLPHDASLADAAAAAARAARRRAR